MISCVCKQNCRFIKINSIAIMCLYCTCMYIIIKIIIIVQNNNNNNNNNKGKISEGRYTDIRPIVVGETLRRLTGKCLCSILRDKFSTFFQPSQFGVACKAGVEKVVHKLRKCIDDGWMSGDFVVCKVDMSNAFNRVSRQAVLDECSSFFPELLPWVSWCYGFVALHGQNQLTVRCSAGRSPWPNVVCFGPP